MRKIGIKRHIISTEDFEGYSKVELIAGDSSNKKQLFLEVTPLEKFMCFRVAQEGEIIETFGTLKDAIDFYNTL